MSRTSTEAAGAPRRVSLNGPTMGSRWTALWYDDGRPDPIEIGRRLVAAVGAVDDQMSTWKPDTALMRLDRAPVGRWQDVPASLATVLGTALDIGRASGGAFDVGVGRLVADWGFGPTRAGRARRRAPVAAAGGCARSRPSASPRPQARADGARSLRHRQGFRRRRTRAGPGRSRHRVLPGRHRRGDARERTQAEGSPWSIAIERPDAATRAVQGILHLEDTAVATSGDYRQFRDGPRAGSRTRSTRAPAAPSGTGSRPSP